MLRRLPNECCPGCIEICGSNKDGSGHRIRIDTIKRRRIKSRVGGITCYFAILVLLGASFYIEQATSFSPITAKRRSSADASTVIRWQSSPPVLQSSSTSSSDNRTIVNKAAIKGAISSSISTYEKIAQLEKHSNHQQKKQQQHRQKKKHSYNKSASKYRKRTQHKKQHGYKGSKGPNKGKGRASQRCSATQNEKRHVRHLYSQAKSLEKRGLWMEATQLLHKILDIKPTDSHSYLALARLESRRERGRNVGSGKVIENVGSDDTGRGRIKDEKAVKQYKSARDIFETGTQHCPKSIHLWHAWGMHEQSLGNISRAKELFEVALEIDPFNGYVNHAYGLIDGTEKAEERWLKGLKYQPSAALVCSLGQLYVSSGKYEMARKLYSKYIPKLQCDRERIEVYLAASNLEETIFKNLDMASQLLKEALASDNASGEGAHDSRAYVALARLGMSGGSVDDTTVKKRLKEICMKQLKQHQNRNKSARRKKAKFPVKDGRLFNAWAKLESKTNLHEALKILSRGMRMYPRDHTLLQAAGNIEERLGNVAGARDLYSGSLHIEPSAPTLIAYGMLELRSPQVDGKNQSDPNIPMVRKLFNEALLIDPKHGPLYNAYGNLELREGNVDRAKQLYEAGVNANCTDASSVYHGLAKLHLSVGKVEEARSVLQRGLALFGTSRGDSKKNNVMTPKKRQQQHNTQQRDENVAFLSHTLAMIELRVNNNPAQAKDVLERGLYHSRNSPQLLLAMALCESRLGNENGARKMFERSLRADQCHAQAWQAFGFMEMNCGNFRAAKTLFECGLKNSPNHGALWQAYGILESWKGEIGKARLLFAAGIEKCPKHVPLYQAWACLELQSGDVVTAKRLIGEALTINKRNGSGWLIAANIEEKMGNQGLVNLILRRGIECAPRDTELYRSLAEHEISRGKIDSARELLEKGIEINPLYAPLYHSLAELEARVFNIEGLAKLNKRTAEIFPSDATVPAKKIKIQHHSRHTKLPDGVAALAEKIGIDSETNMAIDSMDGVDPDSLVNSMCGFGDDSNTFMFAENLPEGRIEDNTR